MAFCLVNLIYIPAALLVHPSVSDILRAGIIPNFPGGFHGALFFFLMANIGTTIAPWMIFFQQSAVVDKNMKEKDIPWGKFDTVVGAFFTIIVAVFVIIVTGTLLYGMNIEFPHILEIWIISQFVEAQRAGIGNLFSYFRGSEGKSYCLQS